MKEGPKPCSDPIIRQKLQNSTTVVAAVGEDVKLPCWVTSGRLLYWLKNNKTLDRFYMRVRVKFNRYLRIKRVRKEDAGFLYLCQQKNECGNTDSFTWNVSLTGK
ncbi:hypothetical protein OS493_032644 [Desmophyllum pertusum]|uniref:Immunoglobulin domain-containing protein n=1 Tax=Desmophyllum pertusum TaxID=174260 RepID=A0A9W9Y8G9_9CNID|nr:hypothetical protein OS493_032644 [Desmophyllum pertusum]